MGTSNETKTDGFIRPAQKQKKENNKRTTKELNTLKKLIDMTLNTTNEHLKD